MGLLRVGRGYPSVALALAALSAPAHAAPASRDAIAARFAPDAEAARVAQWVAEALRDFDAFFAGIAAHGAVSYRWPDENRRAWEAVAAEFFGGVDLVPAC